MSFSKTLSEMASTGINKLVLTPGSAPTATEGAVYYDAATDTLKLHDGTSWGGISVPRYITATGGDVAIGEDGDYKYHVFTASKSGETDGFRVTNVGNGVGSNTVEYMVVAGGGAGVPYYSSQGSGGAGGAGGYRAGTGLSVSAQNYPITVGPGGTAAASNAVGDNGDVSVFNGITATGGGGGGSNLSGTPSMAGAAGGSGGGGSGTGTTAPGGAGVYAVANVLGHANHQGRNGGAAETSANYGSGGGGGASEIGENGKTNGGGDGGNGVTNLIGTASYLGHTTSGVFCGGGGGGSYASQTPGAGGSGGGGAGSITSTAAISGLANSGGGGGGQGTSPGGTAGSGGSGIVIIRYKFQN